MNKPFKFCFSLAAAALLTAPAFAGRDPTTGSLLRKTSSTGEQSMFADKRANRRGDVLTIIVGENATMATSVQMNTSRHSSLANDFSRIFFSDILKRNDETASTNVNIGPNTHEGSGILDNSQRLSARISVQVVDQLPNGNLVLEGIRVVAYGGESFYMLTQGICRPADVARDNTIHSSMIADARIEVIADGDLTDAQRQGWLTRLANRYSP